MSLITCRLCGGSVSTLALACPICLAPPAIAATRPEGGRERRGRRFLEPIAFGVPA